MPLRRKGRETRIVYSRKLHEDAVRAGLCLYCIDIDTRQRINGGLNTSEGRHTFQGLVPVELAYDLIRIARQFEDRRRQVVLLGGR